MKAIINEETATLLHALKNIIKKESGDPKRAEDLEKKYHQNCSKILSSH